ncbi:ABC transporter ATP-binding protein [Leifsonia sp. PS1209]|uniref:energy-coupling factor ABC transporter ATP-binding protein n=1 Tax=Leifsonia sp. PS1209 TaxID=2724914 RepID=UPI001442B88B|nr:ABC transporter ATP-binding protein [Leifsonia sp. PS1209]QIZ99742.1 ABC transporter ATP-binding protein [Leifsonia sp. PS1209]
MSAIALDHLTVRLGETVALDDVSVALDASRIAVVGANGSGKSTFARVLAGLVAPSSGSIRVHGLDPGRQAPALRRLVSVVFSNPDAQIIMPTVAEDAAFSLRSERLPAAESAARVADALDRFGLTGLADRAAHDLSGGQKQLLALCGAFIRRPQLVIADEPTAYLDARNARRVAEHLFEDAGHQLVLLTHDLRLAERCEVAVLFDAGRIAAVGAPADVIAEYEASLRW